MEVRLLDGAIRQLALLDPTVAERIIRRLRWLAANIANVRLEPLHGKLAGFYKLRVGDYRVIFEILHQEELIVAHFIGHRRDIYRRR